MGEDKKEDKKRKRVVPKAPVQMIISREYVGTQTVTEAFIPIISEDIRKKIAEGDTFDNEGLLRMFLSFRLLSLTTEKKRFCQTSAKEKRCNLKKRLQRFLNPVQF